MKIISNRQISSRLSKDEEIILGSLKFKATKYKYNKLSDKYPEFPKCMLCFGGKDGNYDAKSIKKDLEEAKSKFPEFSFKFSEDIDSMSIFIYDLSVSKWDSLGYVEYRVDNFRFQDALNRYLGFSNE